MARELYKSDLQQKAFDIIGDPAELSSQVIIDLFSYKKKSGQAFYIDDLIKIGPNDSKFVKDGTITTLGIYIVNKFLIEPVGIFGYINKTLTGKILKKIDKGMAEARKLGQIDNQVMFDYIDRSQWLFGGTASFIVNTSISSTIINVPPKATKRQQELYKEHAEGLSKGEPQIASKIEKEITRIALEEMRKTDDSALALYDSGCGIDPYNNYKTMFVMKGAIIDNTGESPTGYKTITSNYNQGITKEDMPKIADSLVTGAYAKGVATQDSGYSGKKYNVVFQAVSLADKDTDCGTKETENVKITEDNKDDYGQYRYIVENGKLVRLTPETIDKYVGKTVKMRTPLHCKYKDPRYCNICAGDREYLVGVKNVGQTLSITAGKMLNAGMKKFHDVTIKTYPVEIEDLLRYKDYAY